MIEKSKETSELAKKYKVAHLITHPIQYYSPLYKFISNSPDIDLTVFFQSDMSLKGYVDAGFGREITWDTPLLEGFKHQFLPCLGSRQRLSNLYPISYGIAGLLRHGQFDAVWIHGYARWFNWYALIAARLAGVATLMRDEATGNSTRRSKLKTFLKKNAFFPILKPLTDGFLVFGTWNKKYLVENGFDETRMFLTPHCVDNDFFRTQGEIAASRREIFRQELGLQKDRPVVLYASKFQRRKRAQDLLLAVERLGQRTSPDKRPYLLFVGDGEMRQETEAEAARLGDDVRFLGFRNQSELPAFFDLCDVFVLPADHEPWGLVINEVMSVGRPIVVTDEVGCAVDLVKNGVNGFVYPVGNIDALANSLQKVLASPEVTAAMGRASQEIIAKWGFERVLDGLRQALRRVAS